jgi:hypothetical protein
MRFAVLLIAAVLLAGTCLAAESNAQTAAAERAATDWLSLTDSGKYAGSWEQAAQFFKSSITKEKWTQAMQAVRAPLGKVISRKLKSSTYTTTLPGAPDGQYVVIQYDTSFENKASAVETVTPMRDKDGHWRVSGYFIR